MHVTFLAVVGIRDTPVFLPGIFHRQRSLAGCRPWSYKELDMTK